MVETVNKRIAGNMPKITINRIYHMNNLELLKKIGSGKIDLIFYDPDPPCKEAYINYRCELSRLRGYLGSMRDRLLELHRILKRDGCLYFYCNPRSKFESKLLSDRIFGKKQFRKEIFLKNGSEKRSGPLHDTIFLYAKSNKYLFNLKKWNQKKIKKGYYVYPGQKPLDLLLKIIATSSKEKSLIGDFTCGSGTTLVAAKLLKRDFIGCDKNPEAIAITEKRLRGL
jgi:site-specific DNA-methyltransferase (adenine-specific)